MSRNETKPYRIVGAYDSETANVDDNGHIYAYPMMHQLGILDGTHILEVTPDNVESVCSIHVYRHALDLYEKLDEIASGVSDYVPVILCHNLAFDMYGLSPWLDRHDVRVLAKSARKPITFTVHDDAGNPALVIWDTLIFSQQSLERMGDDCGVAKGVGQWDYAKVRTPETPLSSNELDYAKRDIYTLLAWFGWWLRRNPDIKPERLGLNVVTKTGVVRERRRVRFDSLRGNGQKNNVGRYWLYRCRTEQPVDDDELYTMFAATRGGFTFVSASNASVPFDLCGTSKVVSAYDATSQHPAQICSHVYPIGFKKMTPYVLGLAFELIGKIGFERVLKKWDKPFPTAFYACFRFTNLRPRAGTVFERDGIYPLASARYKTPEQLKEENGDKQAYNDELERKRYCDCVTNAECAFGKIVCADVAELYITELTAWEIWQCYEWDSVEALHGYETGRFSKPCDMDVISVMQFYKAKDEFKHAREDYYNSRTIGNGGTLRELGIAPAIVSSMENGTLPDSDVEAVYLGLKADLNAIFGISCSNQYRRQTVLASTGIEYVGDFGICNAPKNPKVWYQFGQRIVGWSRIAQICAIKLMEPYCDTVVNGDTDSVKVVCERGQLPAMEKALSRLGRAVDAGKARVCVRVKSVYPRMYDELEGIGHYKHEFTSERFCASWNKAYCSQDVDPRDGERHFAFTLAGIPTRRRTSGAQSFIGLNGYADRLHSLGWTFSAISNLMLGYNVTYANDVIRMNARKFPEWNTCIFESVTDYLGNACRVAEPAALALYPMSKTVNDTMSAENAVNMSYALCNNPKVNVSPKLVYSGGILDMEGGLLDA